MIRIEMHVFINDHKIGYCYINSRYKSLIIGDELSIKSNISPVIFRGHRPICSERAGFNFWQLKENGELQNKRFFCQSFLFIFNVLTHLCCANTGWI